MKVTPVRFAISGGDPNKQFRAVTNLVANFIVVVIADESKWYEKCYFWVESNFMAAS